MQTARLRAGLAFAVTSFLPVPLLLAAVVLGGAWPWIAVIYLTVFAFAMDALIGAVGQEGSEFPAADRLSIALAVAHFGVLIAVIWRFGQGIDPTEGIALFLATGLFAGQIGNANAHELIHRRQRLPHTLGKWVYISLLFGHHTSSHPLVHHVHVATARDPNTARVGESYYRFLVRAWRGSFVQGYLAEKRRRGTRKTNPYTLYVGGAVVWVVFASLLGGWTGLFAYGLICFFAQSQLLMSDYVQHYGLRRRLVSGGERAEPVADAHSWNAPHVFTSLMMLHAPRHSAHHRQPGLRYDQLTLPEPWTAPVLPFSLPAMSVIALVPPLWRRVMDRRLAYWQTEALLPEAA